MFQFEENIRDKNRRKTKNHGGQKTIEGEPH